MTFKVLVTCPPMLKQIDHFQNIFEEMGIQITAPKIIQTMSEDDLIKIVPEHDGWIIGDDPATSKVFDAGKNGLLKAAVKWGIGTDNVDFDACKRLEIPITNTPGIFGAEVADLAMCYVLGLAREAFFIDREIRNGFWPKPAGISLNKKVMGIVGLGDIGRHIASRAHAHELKVIGWDPYAENLDNFIHVQNEWPDGIASCDFIVFSCALNKGNYHMLNNDILKLLKPGVRVVNISRGPLIDEQSLLKGLKNGVIHSAALDVFEEEPLKSDNKILDYPKCILGSHNGSNTKEAVTRASNQAILLLCEMLKNNLN